MKYAVFLFGMCFASAVFASDARITRSEYIDMWKDVAIDNMVHHGIPASITLAQGILESGDGNSELARKGNNHFGIKCHSDWTGKRVYHDDDAKGECFRKYKDARESFADHSQFLKRSRYAALFDLDITDYKGWAHGLKKAGYATNPKYADRLITIIEDNRLYEYDLIGLSLITGDDATASRSKSNRRQNKATAQSDKDEAFAPVNVTAKRAVQLSDNRIKFTRGKAGDTFESIAKELDMMAWQIRKYNDFSKNHRISDNEIIYLQPKRARSKTQTHTLSEGETMWDVSQRYGVKLKHLYKRNDIPQGTLPPVGTKLRLR
jgi:LysM repeat protein